MGPHATAPTSLVWERGPHVIQSEEMEPQHGVEPKEVLCLGGSRPPYCLNLSIQYQHIVRISAEDVTI